ncbi:PREDICTED: oxysterol-binding protein-related protein 11-like isoform X1 [Branchiostoma belcheri]|uniref:Oxysterol-binding protein n=1 Tax=Branchiostoma belcheri TaxID=7741 RepID=A0A6P4ZN39_BRABE|nr:PREDICTED: oxysterol-binding protein-related protein 11-like isoform X1 [Branchiostoma belcheri]
MATNDVTRSGSPAASEPSAPAAAAQPAVDLSQFNEAERQQLLAVMARAKELELSEQEGLKRPFEGQLSKYTNVMKGWQYRWFVLDPDSGVLDYYVNEESKKQRPRGSLQLAGSVMSPSDEDSHTFSINAANGEVYRLRAFDAKERQQWVNRLRSVAQYHTETLAQSLPPPHPRSHSISNSTPSSTKSAPTTPISTASKRALNRTQSQPPNAAPVVHTTPHKKTPPTAPPVHEPQAFQNVREILHQAEQQQVSLTRVIEGLPSAAQGVRSLDHDLLLLKATSQTTMQCLGQCFAILQHSHMAEAKTPSLPKGATIEWLEPRSPPSASPPSSRKNKIPKSSSFPSNMSASQDVCFGSGMMEVYDINHDNEVMDDVDQDEAELGTVEEHKSIILHLLSQLKLGMDLTRVVLPTFILEKRSLLEMYADFMAHPDLFLCIPEAESPEDRMMAMVEYYLTAFHVGRKGSLAKKPYNPIIGEVFHCSWDIPVTQPCNSQSETATSSNNQSETSTSPINQSADKAGYQRVVFTAEQVSHHPPVSAFYAECKEKKVCMNAHIWTKSKFMGMSIGVVNVGEGVVHDITHGEEYTFTLPSAYARSILTVPWVELGGKINITCAKSGWQAGITFHTKPFYGGKLHHISGEVKHQPTNRVICKIQGEWNGSIEFTYCNGYRGNDTKVIDTAKLSKIRKKVRPINMQGDFESRKLWQNVTAALKSNDIERATEHKRFLEERQRTEERLREEHRIAWRTKLFHRKGEGWVNNNLLEASQ